jgi:hypothetical protein
VRWRVLSLLLVVALLGGTVVMESATPASAAKCPPSKPGCAPPPAPFDGRCVVWLHGQGGNGQPTTESNGVRYVYPAGNDTNPNGGGRRWLYYGTNGEWEAAVGVLQATITANGCTRVVLDGFSNGGAFAGKIYCRQPDVTATVVGVVADDPVTDHGVDGCSPATGMPVSMYWTGALNYAGAGYDCIANGWTCEGNSLIGRDNYASALGTTWKPSPNRRHKPYTWPPEIFTWLAS